MTTHDEFAPEGAAIYDTPELREAVQMNLSLLKIMRAAHSAIQEGEEGSACDLLGVALRLWDSVAPRGDVT